jgi:hypothetical protein
MFCLSTDACSLLRLALGSFLMSEARFERVHMAEKGSLCDNLVNATPSAAFCLETKIRRDSTEDAFTF